MRDVLPVVEHPVPAWFRLLLVLIGAATIAWPAWDLHAAAWPPNLATPLLGAIMVGAAVVGVVFIATGLAVPAQRWRYVPRTLLVERALWGRQWQVRLDAAHIAAIRVHHIHRSGERQQWKVRIEPMSGAGQSRIAPLDTGNLGSQAAAESALRALRTHFGMPHEDAPAQR